MINIQNLKKIYNGTTVLDIENLDIAQGELVGLVGNNGAGKTTLLRLVLDLIKADDGFVESDGTKKYLRDFSQGNRQKIGIIGAMIINPKVLLLDEPFNYLDPSSQMNIARLIHQVCKEHGTTVIISSHNLNFVADISSRILLLEKGKLIKDLQNTDGAAIAELNEYFGIQAE